MGFDSFKHEVQLLFYYVGTNIFSENVPIETFNISFESTRNQQQYGTKITCTDIRKEGVVMVIRNMIKLLLGCFVVLTSCPT